MIDAQPNIVAILLASVGLGLMTFVIVTMTAFVKIAVVMFLVRNALGIQQAPPNIVLYGIAITLTVYISAPVAYQIYDQLSDPTVERQTFADWIEAGEQAREPVRDYLIRFTTPEEREFFLSATSQVWSEDMHAQARSDDLAILVPSFLISELKRAFQIGFLLYLPFIVIDLVVTTILMSMGMSMVSPTTIAIPFKLFLFVVIEGWSHLLHGLVLSYA